VSLWKFTDPNGSSGTMTWDGFSTWGSLTTWGGTSWAAAAGAGASTYTFPHNPSSMTSPFAAQISVASQGSPIDGRARLHQTRALTEWQFAGKFYNAQQESDLQAWSQLPYPIYVTDHLNRTWNVKLIALDVVDMRPSRRSTVRGTYTMRSIVLGRMS
jgi:hypothetical protein